MILVLSVMPYSFLISGIPVPSDAEPQEREYGPKLCHYILSVSQTRPGIMNTIHITATIPLHCW